MDSKHYAMILLAGQPLFLHQLSLQINEPLRQRISVSYGFKGLAKDEIQPYMDSLLKSAGVTEPLFTPDAICAITDFSSGLPRKINNLAEKSLLVGYQRQTKSLDAEIVQIAQEELDIALNQKEVGYEHST